MLFKTDERGEGNLRNFSSRLSKSYQRSGTKLYFSNIKFAFSPTLTFIVSPSAKLPASNSRVRGFKGALFQQLDQLFFCESALFQNAQQCSLGEIGVERNDGSECTLNQTNVTSLLSYDLKSITLKSFN